MEGVPALRELIEKDDYICKIDLTDAYVVVPIHEDSQEFLSFENEEVVYRYRSLAFGLSVAPRVFSKIMRYAIKPLRKEGLRVIYYLDDICIPAKTKQEMDQATIKVRHHLEKLSFIINYKNSILIPSKTQEFLGFTFNSKTMMISVPSLKITKLMKRIRQLLTFLDKDLQVDSRSSWEDDVDDSSSRGSSSAHKVTTTGLVKNIEPDTPELRSELQVVKYKHPGTTLVGNFHNQRNGLPIQRVQAENQRP